MANTSSEDAHEALQERLEEIQRAVDALAGHMESGSNLTVEQKAREIGKKARSLAENGKAQVVDFCHAGEQCVTNHPLACTLGALATGYLLGRAAGCKR